MGTHDDVLTYRLGTGVLDLAVDADRFGPDLFRVAERINPKRSFLVVSTVLGRHIPVRPRDHFAAVNAIVDQIPDRCSAGMSGNASSKYSSASARSPNSRASGWKVRTC